MPPRASHKPDSAVFLPLLCIGAAALWMLPVLLAGFPYELSWGIRSAREFADTGVMRSINPLFVLLLHALNDFIEPGRTLPWAWVSSVTMALALAPLWYCTRTLFDERTAWATTVIFALMPMHWREAINTGYYPLALLCLHTGFAWHLWMQNRSKAIAAAGLGFFYGLTVATSHAFVPLLPWFVCVYFWHGRAEVRRTFIRLALCGACSYAGFILPMVPSIVAPDLSLSQRLSRFLPVEDNLMPAAELYGDEYSVLFLKEEFDARMIERAHTGSFIEKRTNENFRINHGVGSFNPLQILMTGSWLFANALAGVLMQEVTGGAFLLLLILPGIAMLTKKRRTTLICVIGLWLSMELILRFGFRYARIHLMDIGWIPSLLAGVGVTVIADALTKNGKKMTNVVIAVIVVITGLQLAQSTRMMLAKEYVRSGVPRAIAVAAAVERLPDAAMIAHPKDDQLMVLSDKPSVTLHEDTLDVLAQTNRLAEPFAHYGITHILGYDDVVTEIIMKAVPGIEVIDPGAPKRMEPSPLQKYLLNLIR